MSEVRLSAQPRTEFGKGAARRTRRADLVPAVLYGHGTAPEHLALPGHSLMLALKTPNVLLTLDLGEGRSELALPRDVQRDPIRGHLEHIDLVLVNRGEKVVVEVAVVTTGEAAAGTLVTIETNTLAVEAEATHLPTELTVDISGLAAGTQVHASQVPLPEGTTLSADADLLVVHITAQASEAQAEAELAELEAEAGIEHEAPTEGEEAPADEPAPSA